MPRSEIPGSGWVAGAERRGEYLSLKISGANGSDAGTLTPAVGALAVGALAVGVLAVGAFVGCLARRGVRAWRSLRVVADLTTVVCELGFVGVVVANRSRVSSESARWSRGLNCLARITCEAHSE